jgi:hypothetical protein
VLGPLPAWLITGYSAARETLAHPGISKDVRRFQHMFDDAGMPDTLNSAVTGTMVATDPPDHTRLRRLAAKAFTQTSVEQLRPRAEQITSDLLDAMTPQGPADLIAAFSAQLPVTIVGELLGVPEPDRAQLRGWSAASFNEEDPSGRGKATHDLAAYMAGLIAAKRAQPADDLISRLIAARDSGDQLTDTELLSLVILLLIAGHETTTTLIGNAVHALLTNPAQLDTLHAHPDRIPASISELIRYDGPVAIATIRFTAEPITITGLTSQKTRSSWSPPPPRTMTPPSTRIPGVSTCGVTPAATSASATASTTASAPSSPRWKPKSRSGSSSSGSRTCGSPPTRRNCGGGTPGSSADLRHSPSDGTDRMRSRASSGLPPQPGPEARLRLVTG